MAADPLTKTTVDALFDDDYSDFDPDQFADQQITAVTDTRDDKATLSPRAALKRKFDDDDKENGLGLDEEVKIVKKRKPIAKLDEARLLSEPGIPKLRASIRSGQLSKKLRVKGKGHEFTDTARLLNHFQLWLDSLYPRANFADALQLVEKVGHTKRMQIVRNEWINEGKPGYKRYEDARVELDQRDQANDPDLFGASAPERATGTIASEGASSGKNLTSRSTDELDGDALFIPDSNQPPQAQRDDDPSDDELDALMAEQDVSNHEASNTRSREVEDVSEGEDDLDALLAELETSNPKRAVEKPQSVAAHKVTTPAPTAAADPENDNDNDEDDDLEALLAAQRTKPNPNPKSTPEQPEPNLPTPQPTSPPALEADTEAARDTSSTPIPTPTSQSPVKSQTPKNQVSEPRNLTPMFSSSPMPNNPEDLDPDDLDALLASQEEKTKGA